MRFLIAGLGSIGRRHLRNLLALGERDILLYRTHRATLPDDEFKDIPIETDLHLALDRKPDAVIVSNPTSLHLDIAIPVAEAGCHILLEKPISASLNDVDVLVSAAQRSGSRILVGFQFHFHPMLQKAAQLIRTRAIGRVLSARAQWGEYLPDWHPWEDYRQSYAARPDLGGGVVLTLCHPLDYLHWLLGDVESLTAFTASLNLGLAVEDSAEISLRFASGALGSLHLDYNQRPPTHLFEIVGAEGTLRWNNSDGVLNLYRVNSLLQGGDPAWDTFSPPQGFERNMMFMDEMRHFIEVVGGAQPLCTLQDGQYALRLALAAYHSAEQNKAVKP